MKRARLWIASLVTAALCAGPSQPAMAANAQEQAVAISSAFLAAQWAMLSSAGKAIQQLGVRAAVGSPELASLVRKRQDLVALAAERERMAENAPPGEAQARFIALRGEIDSIQAEVSGIDKEIAQGFPRYNELAHPDPLLIGPLQKLLEDDEGLLLIFSGEGNTYLFGISKTGISWYQGFDTISSLSDDVTALRAELDPSKAFASRGGRALNQPQQRRTVGSFDRLRAYVLYGELVRPVEDAFKGVKHLFVVTDGPLSSLPFSVLVTDMPQGRDDDPAALRDTPWLIKRYALTTLPSVSSLAAMRGYAPEKDNNAAARIAFMGFGAPVLGGQKAAPQLVASNDFFRGAVADVDSVRNLPSLPETAGEIRRLATSLNVGDGDIFVGARATETQVKKSDLSHVNVLAFATHGLVSGDLKGLAEPALVLTPPETGTTEDDGLLTASEIASLHLSADWVILSACNTAASDGRPDADGLSGLARAFLYAGARALLVSHWPVRDDAAARLTTGAVGRIAGKEKVRRAEALRSAMLDVMQDTKDVTLAHPSAWAPFVVVGEGGY